MRPVFRSYTIYVQFPAVASQGQPQNFPDVKELREAIIDSVEIFNSADLTTDPNGVAVIPPADFLNSVVNLVESSTARVFRVPLSAFRSTAMAGQPRQYNDLRLIFTQCSIQPTLNYAAGVPVSVPVTIGYHYDRDVKRSPERMLRKR